MAAAVRRLQVLRRSMGSLLSRTTPRHQFNYHNATSSFIRHFSSSDDHHHHTDAHFDEFMNPGLTGPDPAQLATGLGSGVYDDSILPVRALISILDSYHDLTGLPWWMVIASSTLIMRLTLFPIIVLQIHKLQRIGELFPKLPPPFPPPPGRSIKSQFNLFWKEKRAVGCPSFLWFTAAVFTQVPTFFLWVTTIRRMSLEQYPGFDCGGTLWLQNLTEYSNGTLGPVVPLTIGFLHYATIQISFHKSPILQKQGILAKLAKLYKYYLEFLTLPILFGAFNVPQGSLVYWLANASLSLVQLLTLRHRTVRMNLGLLPDKEPSLAVTSNEELGVSGETENSLIGEKEKIVPVKDLSPLELVNKSLIYLSEGNKDEALPLLRLAIQKDPENGRALIVMGQILLNDEVLADALEFFERVVSRLSPFGNPSEMEDVYLLIMSCQLAGITYAKQNNYEKAIARFQRVGSLEEPKDPKTKELYYDGLVLLSSALYSVGRKPEAAQYVHKLVAYDSKYKYLMEQLEKDEDEFTDDLANSRRGDY